MTDAPVRSGEATRRSLLLPWMGLAVALATGTGVLFAADHYDSAIDAQLVFLTGSLMLLALYFSVWLLLSARAPETRALRLATTLAATAGLCAGAAQVPVV